MEDNKFISHLEDLRGSLLKSFMGLAAGVVVAFAFISLIFKFLSRPYISFLVSAGLPTESVLRSLGPADTLQITLEAALLSGFVLSSPWIAYQIWSFVSPGLYKHERKNALIFCGAATFFFLGGILFAYFIVLPTTISFFYRYTTSMGIVPDWTITNYFGFVVIFLVGFGVVFELPIAVIISTFLGITTSRSLAKYRKHAVVGIFIVAGIVTPGTDIASQLAMAIPMVVLYEISILAARVIEKTRIAPKELNYNEAKNHID
jgi:sec-independent protein translocase protein TatC